MVDSDVVLFAGRGHCLLVCSRLLLISLVMVLVSLLFGGPLYAPFIYFVLIFLLTFF